jgi:type I restriction enzyme S subunit
MHKPDRTGKTEGRRVKFGDVVRQIKDKVDPETAGLERYVAGEHMDTDDLRISRWGVVGDGYLGPAFHMRFKPGQVLYGSRRTYLRKVAAPDFEGICANTTFVLESKDPNVLLPDFLPFLMQTEAFNSYSVKNSKGSVNPYINYSDLAEFEFVLPSLESQRGLVTALEALEVSGIFLGEVATRAQQLKKALMNEHFNNVHEVCCGVQKVGEWYSGGTPARGNPSYWGGDIPWISPRI